MKPYESREIPFRTEIDYNKLIKPLLNANASVSKYDGMLEEQLVNEDLFINPLTRKEAQLSSQIEGTQVTLIEVLEIEADNGKVSDKNKYDDFIEVLNYNKAIKYAEEEVKEKRKINLWLIRNIHKILLSGARGADKTPGKFRIKQNWVGKPGCSQEEASFVPVAQEKLEEVLEKFEKYLVSYEEESPLIQAAVIHAQFEKIHPFMDGNGRIGRMLIPLYLYYKGIVKRPAIYISEYFEKHRDEYYEKLQKINEQEGWGEWILFFLKAIETQANLNINKIKELQQLHEEYSNIINEVIGSKNSIYIISALFKRPIFKVSNMYDELKGKLDVDKVTIRRYIKKLELANILTAEKNVGYNRKYYFTALVNKIK